MSDTQIACPCGCGRSMTQAGWDKLRADVDAAYAHMLMQLPTYVPMADLVPRLDGDAPKFHRIDLAELHHRESTVRRDLESRSRGVGVLLDIVGRQRDGRGRRLTSRRTT